MFSETEIKNVKKHYKLRPIADLFGVTKRYVSQILNNERAVNTATAKNIYNMLKRYARTAATELESDK